MYILYRYTHIITNFSTKNKNERFYDTDFYRNNVDFLCEKCEKVVNNHNNNNERLTSW